MIFTIINPSDPYTMDAASLKVAAVAICLLGHGLYGLVQCDGLGKEAVPPFPVGGHETYFLRKFGAGFEAVLQEVDRDHMPQLVEALGSVLYGTLDHRREAMARMRELSDAARVPWLLQWHDKHRGSTNDIGRRAWALSNQLAAKLAEVNAATTTH